MSRNKWVDAPHEKVFLAVIVAIVLFSILFFAKQVAGL